jgi:hypothetical protein
MNFMTKMSKSNNPTKKSYSSSNHRRTKRRPRETKSNISSRIPTMQTRRPDKEGWETWAEHSEFLYDEVCKVYRAQHPDVKI